MFLQLSHSNLDVYKASRQLVLECYKLTKKLPEHEKYGLTRQIRRAATSVTLNIAEGCSRRSELERNRFFEIARGSVIEIDSAFDLVSDQDYCRKDEMQSAGDLILRSFQMLSKMIKY